MGQFAWHVSVDGKTKLVNFPGKENIFKDTNIISHIMQHRLTSQTLGTK